MNLHRSRIAIPAITGLMVGILAAASLAQEPAGSGATQASSAPSSPDKVVIKVGNQQVTQAEFDSLVSTLGPQAKQAFAGATRHRFGEQYAMLLLLSQQGLSDHIDTSPEVQRQIAFQRIQILANAEMQNLTRQSEPKPEEIAQYYSSHLSEFEEVRARKVFLRKKPEGANEHAPGLDPKEAKSRAEEIRKALAAGGDTKKVAADFNDNKNTFIDQEPRALRHGQLPADQEKATFALKDGELSEIQDTPQGIAFTQVVSHGHQELKEATPVIQKKLQREKLDTTLEDLKKKATFWLDDDYFKPPPSATGPPPSAPVPKPQGKN